MTNAVVAVHVFENSCTIVLSNYVISYKSGIAFIISITCNFISKTKDSLLQYPSVAHSHHIVATGESTFFGKMRSNYFLIPQKRPT